ncbi:cyclic nucleotide-binding domain-containing protein [Bacteroidota bacterium]
MSTIREATDKDVEQIRDIFVQVYGKDYPFKGFYDTEWLKKSVYDDGTLFLVMEMDNKVIASASMMLTSGGLDDMIGEAGRLVATTDKRYRGKGLYTDLIIALMERTKDRVLFLMGEARTPHRGSQKILEELKWIPAGFEPMKYLLGKRRESIVFYIQTQGIAKELRRNNPRVIAEASVLAQTVLNDMNYPADLIVDDEVDGYPTNVDFEIKHLTGQRGIISLLRIERGRITNKEIFGNFSLSQGFFRIANEDTSYLIAKDGDAVLGAVGFSYDQIDRKIRIFELIEFNEAVKGALLASLDRIATEEYNVDYMEVDVSAYSPKIQRTFERLGFIPVVYCPSMVFEKVERLDIIRMAKLKCRYDLGQMRLLEPAQNILEIVEKSLDDRLIGIEITDGTKNTELFRDIPDGDLYHLASISNICEYKTGTTLVKKGDVAKELFILLSGEVKVKTQSKDVILKKGSVFGEMALVERSPRTANVVMSKDGKVIKIDLLRLERLMAKHPRIGCAVSMNLARSLSSKLRKN